MKTIKDSVVQEFERAGINLTLVGEYESSRVKGIKLRLASDKYGIVIWKVAL